jgi:methionine sulfoxide reductase heme-binding subunit
MDGPLLWFANRGTGVVLLVLLTVTTLLGVLSTRGNAGHGLPRFVTQSLHRNLSLISLALLVVHAGTAVLDEYVDIRWWQALVPLGGTYEPLWLALGTLALDLIVVVVLTSLVRHRLPHRPWRAIHLAAYASWALAVLHGFGMGSDSAAGWARWTTVGCVAAVATAATIRGVDVWGSGRRRRALDRTSGFIPSQEQAR